VVPALSAAPASGAEVAGPAGAAISRDGAPGNGYPTEHPFGVNGIAGAAGSAVEGSEAPVGPDSSRSSLPLEAMVGTSEGVEPGAGPQQPSGDIEGLPGQGAQALVQMQVEEEGRPEAGRVSPQHQLQQSYQQLPQTQPEALQPGPAAMHAAVQAVPRMDVGGGGGGGGGGDQHHDGGEAAAVAQDEVGSIAGVLEPSH